MAELVIENMEASQKVTEIVVRQEGERQRP